MKEVDNDIERILRFSKNLEYELRNRLINIDEYSIIGVIIADVWTENDDKKRIKASFESKKYLSEFAKNFTIDSPIYFCLNFNDVVFLNEIKKKHQAIKETYNLVGIIWTINNP